MNLRKTDGRPLVIGHRGAAAVAPENTLAALEAAVAARVDLVEFDISPGLRLGHSLDELPHDSISLDEAFEYLKAHDVGVHLDVKLPGYEEQVLEAIERHAFAERAVLSTAFAVTARRFARLAPDLPRAIGYPRDRLGVSNLHWPPPLQRAGATALRQAMPVRVPLLLRWARANTLSLHHTLCSRAAVATAHRLGAPVLAWTVNDPAGVRRVTAAGVDGIVSDDPEMTVATLLAL
ncbi:MAG: glycerophosphoryl diester phosphodiesterase [Actinomycetia bacterium]|nr:glycerophosphoryl diester phosphodiesterase [Actinomycetes bacterium]